MNARGVAELRAKKRLAGNCANSAIAGKFYTFEIARVKIHYFGLHYYSIWYNRLN